LRVVHASWSPLSIALVGDRRFTNQEFLVASSSAGTSEHRAVSTLVNGPEIELPQGGLYRDKDGHARKEIRVRWFSSEEGKAELTFRDIVFPSAGELPNFSLNAQALDRLSLYGEAEPPVIFGHYWMTLHPPKRVAKNVACVDYSVAAKAGGFLTAYRCDGEQVLSNEKFLAVRTV